MISRRWDVVVVPFPFSDRPGHKRRPALVLTNSSFNRGGHTVLSMITSSGRADWPGDVELKNPKSAGLSVRLLGSFQTLHARQSAHPEIDRPTWGDRLTERRQQPESLSRRLTARTRDIQADREGYLNSTLSTASKRNASSGGPIACFGRQVARNAGSQDCLSLRVSAIWQGPAFLPVLHREAAPSGHAPRIRETPGLADTETGFPVTSLFREPSEATEHVGKVPRRASMIELGNKRLLFATVVALLAALPLSATERVRHFTVILSEPSIAQRVPSRLRAPDGRVQVDKPEFQLMTRRAGFAQNPMKRAIEDLGVEVTGSVCHVLNAVFVKATREQALAAGPVGRGQACSPSAALQAYAERREGHRRPAGCLECRRGRR